MFRRSTFNQVQSWPSAYLWENTKRGVKTQVVFVEAQFALLDLVDFVPIVETVADSANGAWALLAFISNASPTIFIETLAPETVNSGFNLLAFVTFVPLVETPPAAEQANGEFALLSLVQFTVYVETLPAETANGKWSMILGP